MSKTIEEIYREAKEKYHKENGNKNAPNKISTEIKQQHIFNFVEGIGYCPNCGMTIMPPESNYCWNCGEKLEYKETADEPHVSISLLLDELGKQTLNKIAMDMLKGIKSIYECTGYEKAIEFCEFLADKDLATVQLCKKCGAICAKFEDYDYAIYFYEKAMEIDVYLDLTAQIERFQNKLYG